MKRIYAGFFALVGWFAVVGQYFASHDRSLSSTVDYLSYFTILCNILVAASLTSAALAPPSAIGRYLARPGVALAAAVYISVTGLTYFLILSGLYDLKGWVLFFDRLLHYVMPPAYVIFWLAFVPKGSLRLSVAAWVLIPPIAYAVYTFVHGPWTGFYPYPFVDVPKNRRLAHGAQRAGVCRLLLRDGNFLCGARQADCPPSPVGGRLNCSDCAN